MVSFLTPYWSGREMMTLHLASVRRFHPDAPVLVSTRGADAGEIGHYRREFGVDCHLEECGYTSACLRLLLRCRTRYACVLDHDTILLSSLDRLLQLLDGGRCDLVGIEERIRLPESIGHDAWPGSNGWLRFAPGCAAANFLVFDWQAFKSRWGLGGVFGRPSPGARHFDFDYGIGQRLRRHHYLQPFHAPNYGIGNLLKAGETAVLWHQWYGSYRTRLADGTAELRAIAEAGERRFIADYPNLDLGGLSPAWGPDRDVAAEERELARRQPRHGGWLAGLRRSAGYQWRALAARAVVGLEPRDR